MNLVIFLSIISSTVALLSTHNRRVSLTNIITTSKSPSVSYSQLYAKPIIEGETDEEILERLKKKMRKNLYSEKGVAYAPWVTNQIDEDAILEDAFRKEKEFIKNGGKKAKTTTLDRGEIEFSEGMKWRMSGDQIDLAWITGSEANNKGILH